MIRFRLATVLLLAFSAVPAHAQFYWQSPDFRGAPITPGEVGIGVALPGATPDEQRAAIAWQLRAGLNIMALQCQFDRTLLSENHYNAAIYNHKAELETVYAKLTAYFKRTAKTPREAQRALDQYGTRTYAGMTTVRGQYGFCATASRIARAAIFLPRGSFTALAVERLRELRNSLALAGEQQFRFGTSQLSVATPPLEDRCWDRRGNFRANRCPAAA
ncbi:MAG: hypothetical protein ACKVOP_02350 [Sphingomonadaceae bacterium]